MSEIIINFIPNDPYYMINDEQVKIIKGLDWFFDDSEIEVNDRIEYVMPGENFGDVLCPFCGSDLGDWWGDAMNDAYSTETGFNIVDIPLPCCGKLSSLQNLDYKPMQGMYKTVIMLHPYTFDGNLVERKVDILSVCEQLEKLTGTSWRAVETYI